MTLVAVGTIVATRVRQAPADPPEYREALVAAHRPLSLNPLIQGHDAAVHDVSELLYRRLLRLDERAYPVPDLATSVSISTDGLNYTLTMPPGISWSDATPLTSGDVLATVAFIQSAADPDPALRAGWEKIKVSAGGADHRVVVFTVPAPRAAFSTMLAELPILPLGRLTSAEVGDLPNHASRAMASSGPYRVVTADANAVELDVNPHSARTPQLHRLELQLVSGIDEAAKLLNTGGVDAVLASSSAEQAKLVGKGRTARMVPTFRFVDLLFNERVGGLGDASVRKAIAVAVDRAACIEAAGGMGVPEVGPIPAAISWAGASGGATPPSQAAAVAGLEAAGWRGPAPRSRAGALLSFSLSVPDVAPLPAVATELKTELAAIGVVVSVHPVPAGRFLSDVIAAHAFDLALADWDNSADPDVSTFWRSDAQPPHGFNVAGGAPDPFLDQALDSLATLSDVDQRRQAAVHVEAQLADDLPAVFLYSPQQSFVSRDGLKGVQVSSSGNRYQSVVAWHH